MKSICLKVLLKPSSKDGVRNWFKTLGNAEKELMKTLEKEDVFVESPYLDSDEKGII